MASNEPYSTIDELPDFDIEFPEGSFDPETEEEETEDDWSDFDALPHDDDYPYGDIDDEYESRQGFDHPIHWLG
tara:strand:+ start:261 stop:482 length:222 start_codon:yes stop_codon:yes gene_type:complete